MIVKCPGCGRDTQLANIQRAAHEFCKNCDYPLFWAQPDRPELVASNGELVSRRRLPGTIGTVTVGHRLCPKPDCHDPNPMTATHCKRCGTDLDWVPEPEPAPAPPPPPPAPVVVEPPGPDRTPWIVAALCGVAALLAIIGITL